MATRVESTTPTGERVVVYKIDGFAVSENMIDKMMPAKDLDLQLKWMKETEIRDDDVIICAFPKTAQFCCYMWYLKHWEQFRKDNPDYPLLDVFYEDVKKDPEGEIKKIAKFLGKEIDESLVKEITEKCNFQNMKLAHENKNDVVKDRIPNGTNFMYRKGTIGDWKNYLTVAENEAYDKWIESELKDSNITFTYE